ncbi:hypothetical protein DL98DRAFT_522386 [Cadophora sp. DSE1049]|nr:hypothetical protein DL98DRAFT_522386 [Cadophora sp. DSE1049]
MRFSPAPSLLFAGLAFAEPFAEGQSPAIQGLLAARVLSGDATCAETWGTGSIICSLYNCFNPTLGEQCCGGGYNCVGSDNSCCGTLGPGVTGTDGVPATSTLATPITPPGSSSTSWTCSSGDSGEECCQRLSSSQHWCSGSYPNFLCYNPDSQSCCSDGSRCLRDNCCELVGATAVTPNFTAQASGSSSSTLDSVNSASTTAQTETTRSTNLVASTANPNVGSDGAAIRNTVGGIAAAALGAVGMAWL